MDRLLLRPGEVAECMGCSRSLVYQLIAQGDLAAINVGRRSLRVPVAEVERWIRANMAQQDEGKAPRSDVSAD